MEILSDPWALVAVIAALALGGALKGATGAGSPVVAVPVIAAYFDIRMAVAIMVVPNLITNLVQIHQYRDARLPGGFALRFALAGTVGVALGTVLLANIAVEALTLALSATVLAYIVLRLVRPDFQISMPWARKMVLPAGAVGGVLQGAAGISAPISLTFLNAMRLDRPAFIVTVSAFFAAMSLVQIPILWRFGLIDGWLLGASALALIPQVAAMSLGAWIARRITPATFDKLMLVFLTLMAIYLAYSALT